MNMLYIKDIDTPTPTLRTVFDDVDVDDARCQ
jgi:hypothetical protein